jgi:hypothetical protein
VKPLEYASLRVGVERDRDMLAGGCALVVQVVQFL